MTTFEPVIAGLRERSKLRRRAAIQREAMRLFAERGYDATTIADVAEAAEVAPRTVSAYFPTKVDLATSYGGDIAQRFVDTLRADPDADFMAALDRWLAGEAEGVDVETAALAHAMNETNPTLAALTSACVGDAIEVAGAALTSYLGLREDDPMLRICGSALAGVIAAYLDEIAREDVPGDLHGKVMALLTAIVGAVRVT